MKVAIKNAVLISFLLTATFSFAETPQIDKKNMQQFLKNLEKTQNCMANVDQSKLKALETRSKKFREEVKSLCEGGNRGTAQKKAIAFRNEIIRSPTVKVLKGCTKELGDMVSKLTVAEYTEKDSNSHVCDSGL